MKSEWVGYLVIGGLLLLGIFLFFTAIKDSLDPIFLIFLTVVVGIPTIIYGFLSLEDKVSLVHKILQKPGIEKLILFSVAVVFIAWGIALLFGGTDSGYNPEDFYRP